MDDEDDLAHHRLEKLTRFLRTLQGPQERLHVFYLAVLQRIGEKERGEDKPIDDGSAFDRLIGEMTVEELREAATVIRQM